MSKEKIIPNKMYFRIGEAAELLGVKPYVLRYWETEFPDIKPSKSKSSQRLYKRRDVETLQTIKRLLYDEKFTINGAREHLKDTLKGAKEPLISSARASEAGPAKRPAGNAAQQAAAVEAKKTLLKVKNELEWCLNELRK